MGYKVKKIYVGTQKVRPAKTEIYVDWTKLSALPSGWSHSGGSYSFNNGLYCSYSGGYYNNETSYHIDMSKLKKITLESNGYRSSVTYAGGDEFGITEGIINSNIRYNSLVHRKSYNYNATVSDQNGLHGYTNGTITRYNNFTTGQNTGNWNNKTIINFTTGEVTISSTAPYTYSYTYTLPAAKLTEIKTYGYVFLIQSPANGCACTIYNTSIIYE